MVEAFKTGDLAELSTGAIGYIREINPPTVRFDSTKLITTYSFYKIAHRFEDGVDLIKPYWAVNTFSAEDLKRCEDEELLSLVIDLG